MAQEQQKAVLPFHVHVQTSGRSGFLAHVSKGMWTSHNGAGRSIQAGVSTLGPSQAHTDEVLGTKETPVNSQSHISLSKGT